MSRNYLQLISDAFNDVIEAPGSILLSNDEQDFWGLLEKASFSAKRLVEIGTGRGISTTLLSEVADEIWTFDLIDYPIRKEIWKHFGVDHKIHSYIIEDYLDTAGTIASLDFNAAFVDGNHFYEHVVCDTFLLERCGNILFHDYHIEGVRCAIDHLLKRKGGMVFTRGKYAFWTNRST